VNQIVKNIAAARGSEKGMLDLGFQAPNSDLTCRQALSAGFAADRSHPIGACLSWPRRTLASCQNAAAA
jgi:hypothetical protein